MATAELSFEALRDRLTELTVPAGEARSLVWVVENRLGAAKTSAGAYEIFLLGPALQAALPLVASHLLYDRWEPSAGGQAFEASRILLGADAHFAAVAALIATEFGRFDLTTDDDLQRAFSGVEPIIELAIRRAALSKEAIIGLIAELHTLRVLLLAVPVAERPTMLLSWRGWQPGRDFQIGRHGIEVKATLGGASRHSFSGIHQLEPQAVGDDAAESVHLLSVGMQQVATGGQSLPELTDDLLDLLADGSGTPSSPQTQLLAMIASYGGAGGPSYVHRTMSEWSAYQQRYALAFVRLYELADPAMRLLHRELVEQTFVVSDSVSFDLLLPPSVSAFNPAESWQTQLAAIAKDQI